MVSRGFVSLALAAGTLLGACSAPPSASQAGAPGESYTDVSPAQLTEMLKTKDFFFVNVHVPYEGEIDPTDAFIPYDETEQRLSEYPADKSAKIVLYCRSGSMSAIAAEELAKAGYTNVWNLDGGMIAWDQAGLPLIRK